MPIYTSGAHTFRIALGRGAVALDEAVGAVGADPEQHAVEAEAGARLVRLERTDWSTWGVSIQLLGQRGTIIAAELSEWH